jgi:UDP-glucuronate 4-epimerase
MKILVTGCAGFIGFHVAKRLLERGDEVIGVDNLNKYYDVTLKMARVGILESRFENFTFKKIDISKYNDIFVVFRNNPIEKVMHLAAQAGVRYSIEEPFTYQESNIKGFLTVLEMCRVFKSRLIYASSSSVYGDNPTPFKELQTIPAPINLYGVTKLTNELMASAYHDLYDIPCIGLRYFTVYGPWGRPDMALFKFVKAILEDKPIDVYNKGVMVRDFTYIDDIVDGTVAAIDSAFEYEILNLGSSQPAALMNFIKIIEMQLGKKAEINSLPMQMGDVQETISDITRAKDSLGYEPKVAIGVGIHKFVTWYKEYYGYD